MWQRTMKGGKGSEMEMNNVKREWRKRRKEGKNKEEEGIYLGALTECGHGEDKRARERERWRDSREREMGGRSKHEKYTVEKGEIKQRKRDSENR